MDGLIFPEGSEAEVETLMEFLYRGTQGFISSPLAQENVNLDLRRSVGIILIRIRFMFTDPAPNTDPNPPLCHLS